MIAHMTNVRWISAVTLAWLSVLLLHNQQAIGQGFSVGNYEVLSSTRVGRTTFDFVMRATITNNSLPAQGVLARATSTSTNTTVVSRTLQFGTVNAGSTAVSTNTFTIRQNRLVPFDPASLQWAVSVQSMQLALTLDSPHSGFLTNGTNIVVSGAVGPAVTAVEVNGIRATLTGSNYTALVPLVEGRNTLSAVAQNSYGGSGTANVVVNRDTMPAIITIGSPTKGAVVSSAQLAVGGNINDIVFGTTVSGDQVTVSVNGIPATVANRSYFVPEVLLARGKNKITVLARDLAGNESTAETEVVYQEVAAQKRLVLVGGNNQSGVIATTLPDPLLVALLDANGAALTNQPVTFAVALNDGVVHAAPNSGRQLSVLTDDKGLASVLLQLGTRVGAGNNQIIATSPGVATEVAFTASSLVGPPSRINALLPETQVGETGRRLPAPWIAFVTDAGGNPVANTPVTFTVSQGAGATLEGATQITKTTDTDGRVSVLHTLGTEEGINNNVIVAQISTETNALIAFKASALTAQRAEDTRVVGLVLDNANRPMTNVFCGITGTRLITLTDQNGQFVLSNAPVGSVRLFVDSRDRGYPGTWEVLEFDLVTIAGRANSVDRPIYMLPLDDSGSAIAGGAQNVTLQMKGIPGATMTIFSNSVRNASGQPIAERVMFTQVNAERLPMPPPRGSQFMLAWTVQPAGLRFNPPAQMCIPNNGLPPGQVIELFSFDHDLVQFVAIGTARVSADGAQICSDPGFGVMKSGWGGGGPPPQPPCTGACKPPADTDCGIYEVTPPSAGCSCPNYTLLPAEITKLEPRANDRKALFICLGETAHFTANAEAKNCKNGLEYEWSFDDGLFFDTKSTEQNPTFTYAKAGLYTVSLKVQCKGCSAASKTETVTVVAVELEKMQYKRNGAWTDVPSLGFLDVCKGTTINVRAVPKPAGSIWPENQPVWSGNASGTGEEATATFSASAGVIAVQCGTIQPAKSVPASVGVDNSVVAITWDAADYSTTAAGGSSTTVEKPFGMECDACADPSSDVWRLRVKKITGDVTIVAHLGGSRDPIGNPPTTEAEAQDAVKEMKAYYSSGRGDWHTEAATAAHEGHHYSEWQCAGDHYWPSVELCIEKLTVPYASYTTAASALPALRAAGADTMLADFKQKAHDYWFTLSDKVGSRPYAAGQLVLNSAIISVQNLAAMKGWTVPAGVSTPSAAIPCYQPFPVWVPCP